MCGERVDYWATLTSSPALRDQYLELGIADIPDAKEREYKTDELVAMAIAEGTVTPVYSII